MPKRTAYQVQWSPLLKGYAIFHDGKPVMPGIGPASQQWSGWLDTISSFSFQSRSGASCTVRKETVQRGGTYWYAYRRKGQGMVKRYLARGADLTLPRLEMVTNLLHHPEASSKSMPAIDTEADHVGTDPEATISTEDATYAQPLLTTKLRIPRLPVHHVPRPRLYTLLQQGAQGPLTVISASAGSGKTTLLAEWASTTDLPVAWLSLETADNDPVRFLSYLTAALATWDERLGTTLQAYHITEAQKTEQVLTGIINDLTYQLQQDVVIILDDYHVLTVESVHALVRTLLDHLPPHLHLLIGTRIDPPLSLARLRVRGQLSEIRPDILRFFADEVEALVRAMGLALSGEAVGLMEQHTEGWIAGVQLLALALRGQTDATAFLQTFRGTHHFLLDYVSEEVLAQQPSETQRFLLSTSILERMTGPLCDAITGLADGQARLTALRRANLFVTALDDTETWYRYHPLFANALHVQLEKLEPELIPQLYLRASFWYEQHQHMEEACDYAFLAGDLPRAAILVARLLPHLVEQGRFEQLKPWLNQLPPDLIAASPQLSITQPWLHALSQRPQSNAEQTLQRMEQYIQEQPQDMANAWVEPQTVLTLFRALIALSQNNPLRAFALARDALRVLASRETDLSHLLKRFLQIILSIAYGARGDLAKAEQTLLDLSASLVPEKPSMINMAAMFLLGELYKAQGKLHTLFSLYHKLFQPFGQRNELPPAPLLLRGFALMRRACLFYEWNRLSEATHDVRQALDIIPQASQEIVPPTARHPLVAFGLWVQARTELAQGRPEAAHHFLQLVHHQPEICGELPPGKEHPPVDVPVLAARLALACHQLEDAEHWEQTCGICYDDVPRTLLESRQMFAYLTLARVLIARGRTLRTDLALSQALILLGHWRDCALHLGFQGWFIEIQMLTALALQAQGQTRQALTTLGSVLAQAEQEHYLRLFADEGQPMARLLMQIAPYTTASPGYIQRLLAAIPTPHQSIPDHAQLGTSHPLIDPLSAREREVLSLLAAGASNQQIADHLVISLNTAKRHVKHILAKLAVINRTQAVVRAQELHLL